MNRPAQIRAIFAELRRVLDATYSDRELLRLAHGIVLAHTTAGQLDGDYATPPPAGGSVFDCAVDAAMDDGGWRVLDFESKRGTACEGELRTELEDDFSAEVRSLISRLNQIRRAQ